MVTDFRRCDLDPVDLALCQYALRLTLRPDRMGRPEIETLQSLGLDPHQITIATQVISYFNYINRIADGLGVDHEPWMELDPDQWRRDKPDWRALLEQGEA